MENINKIQGLLYRLNLWLNTIVDNVDHDCHRNTSTEFISKFLERRDLVDTPECQN